jgi:tRNA (guanine-N7-)-methyltransferase
MPAPARRSVFADRLLEFPDLVFSDGREFHHRGRWRDWFASRIGGSGTPGGHRVQTDTSQGDGAASRLGQECPTHQIECPTDRLILDIGCNDGGLLATVAARHPTTAFIGIDWKPRVLHAAAERVAAAGLRNVALLHGRAQDIRRLFADGELDEIWLFHPEPLDNPRELKNRLLAEPFLRDAHAVLCAGGSLMLKTDHGGYFDVILNLLLGMTDRFSASIASRDFWGDTAVQVVVAGHAFAGEMTAFESRFVRKRKPIYFVRMDRR